VLELVRTMHGFLLFSHGSLLCGAGQALCNHAAGLRERLTPSPVEIGYLNYSEPSMAEGIDRLVASGCSTIVIVPYFLVPGYFVSRALPQHLGPIKLKHPGLAFVIADALGEHELLADALLDSAARATPAVSEWRDLYSDAAAHCRNRPDCPINGSPRCPASPGRKELENDGDNVSSR
jgi:sirohydrochlorin ferrochelatase